MKMFTKYIEELAVAPQAADAPQTTDIPQTTGQKSREVKNITKTRQLKQQIYQKFGQPGTKITAAQEQEIGNIYIQNGEDAMNAPIIVQQGTNQAFIESVKENKMNLKQTKVMDLKESLVLDRELQSYIDICDKILYNDKSRKREEDAQEGTMGNIAGRAVGGSSVVTPQAPISSGTPMVMQLKKAPTDTVQKVQAQQSGTVDPSLLNALRQMKIKMNGGQDISQDLQTLLQSVK